MPEGAWGAGIVQIGGRAFRLRKNRMQGSGIFREKVLKNGKKQGKTVGIFGDLRKIDIYGIITCYDWILKIKLFSQGKVHPMSYSFQGGVYLDANREKTLHKPCFAFDRVASVKIPLGGSGMDFTPAVAPGDPVRLGQVIAVSTILPGFGLHASISGTVTEIGDGVLPDGRFISCIEIENDLRDEPEPAAHPMDWQQMEPEQINEAICAAGIVGRDAYPSFVKIGRMLGHADTLIVDGLDGEPWESAVYRALCEDAADIVEGVHVLMRLFGRLRCAVAMPEERGEAAQAMRRAVGGDNRIRLVRLRDKYPQNDEGLLIRTITGRESGGGYRDDRCLVLQAQEMAAIGRALRDGTPDICRIVTVSGDAVANPKNIRARIGTAWYELVRVCGGYTQTPNRLIVGGVMRGEATFTDNIAFAPGAQAFTALCADTTAPGPCLHCGRCAQACPYGVMPSYVHLFLEKGNIEKLAALGVERCTACGACACVCPAHIRLVQTLSRARRALTGQEERQG